MRILISNDDGYRAKGIQALHQALEGLGELTIVAPDRNRSGASNSLTLDVPVRVGKAEPGTFFVLGTPTDCVHLAISGLFDVDYDLVVSGINDGENLGDDTLYSGTVAAAMEGRFLGKAAVAVSLQHDGSRERHFATAGHYARLIVERLIAAPIHPTPILSVNVPNLPLDEIKGVRVTRLGNRHRSEKVIRATDPRGRTVYWIGPSGAGQDAGEETDFHAVANGYVSVTPLSVDLTRHSEIGAVRGWLAGQ